MGADPGRSRPPRDQIPGVRPVWTAPPRRGGFSTVIRAGYPGARATSGQGLRKSTPRADQGDLALMQHEPIKPGATSCAPIQPRNSTVAHARSSLVPMQHDTSKREATGTPSNAVDPIYIDDKELERRVPAIRRPTWQKMRIEGRGPAWIKIGRRCVYSWPDVVAWLESHRVDGAAVGGAVP
jgi:hypothetical protein